MNENTSKIIFNFNQWLGWNFKENSSYRANACYVWDSLFINSDKAPKYIFETIADLLNTFIQQLIWNTKVIKKSINLNWLQ